MENIKLVSVKPFFVFTTLVMLLFGSANKFLAESSPEDLQNYLTAQAKFDNDEFSKLENGEPIAKLLPSTDKREVAVLGLVPLSTPLDLGLKTFQETMARQNKKSIMEFGNFSATPSIEDLRTLTLETGDIEDLRQCRVGNCRLQLSTAMIERFQKDVDWNAPDYAAQATLLFRQLILEYIEDYLSRGNPALIEYNDQREAVDLHKEQDSLLKELSWLNDFAPEFSKYLQDSSSAHSEPANVRKSISWSKLKFGLKPVIVITQTLTYTTEKNGVSQILSVSKQLYASRYFDSSLGLTALIKYPETNSPINSYLLYINQSRSSALDGALSKFKHEIVEQQAIEKLKSLLQDTRAFCEASLRNQGESTALSGGEEIREWLSDHYKLVWLLVLLTVAIGILGFGKIISNQSRQR